MNMIAATGNDKQIWYRAFDGTAWANWTTIGGISLSEPMIGTIGTKDFIFCIGTDNALWYMTYDNSTNQWSQWTSLGGIVYNLLQCQVINNQLYVSVVGTNNTIYYRIFNPTSNIWSDYQSLGIPQLQIQIPTQLNDNFRSGNNLNETILNPSNVNINQFGKLFSRQVDGQIYAQPLYLQNVKIQKIASIETHNVIFIATMHNTVYAFDADIPSQSQPFWSINLGPSIPLPDPNVGVTGYITVEIGILSTPAISLSNNSIYVVSTNKDPNKPQTDPTAYSYTLYSLDITTGKIKNSKLIAATYPGQSSDATNGVITFNSQRQLQRSSLLYANNKVYVSFTSHEDITPCHGWIMSYDGNTLSQISVFNTTPNGQLGTIWMGGRGPTTDKDGNIYVSTGNGDFDGDKNPNPTNFSDCVLKLSPDLKLLDWFSPFDNAFLNQMDTDLGSGGVLLISNVLGKDLLTSGGKASKAYLIDKNNLGHFNPTNDNQIVQSFYVGSGDGNYPLMNVPVYWNNQFGKFVYYAVQGFVASYKFNSSGTLDAANQTVADLDWFGGWLSISANNQTQGILWLSGHKNVIHAYDASNLKEIWNSNMNPTVDAIHTTSKFCPLTIANGKVYVPTFDGLLLIYGLK